MTCLHIANLTFEDELITGTPLPENLYAHKNFLQLQFLPLLYAKKGDGILITHLPEQPGPFHLYSESDLPYDTLTPWGAVPSLHSIANACGLPDPSLPLDLLQTITSKLFTFHHLPKLPGSRLIETPDQLTTWIDGTSQVLKTPFGFSGRGHHLLPSKDILPTSFPLIGEPWVKRERDFSSHWNISSSIDLLGHTHILSTKYGGFRSATTGLLEPFLDKHCGIAKPLLEKVQSLGYRGPLSIDAFVYNNQHHICEINPRKTFGSVALHLGSHITLTYKKGKEGLLPSRLKISPNQTLEFPLQLYLTPA